MEVIIRISAREVREIADLIEARRDRPNVAELANRIKNRTLSAKFIPEKNSSVSRGRFEMNKRDIQKTLRRIRKALSPKEHYELIIHTANGETIKYIGRPIDRPE